MGLAPFLPAGAKGEAMPLDHGGSVWPTMDGGWAFQYPDMAMRAERGGRTRIAWAEPVRYSMEFGPSGASYHTGDRVVHRDVYGGLVYHQASGTVHAKGDTLIYHWCQPNVIVYQTPSGVVYYDDTGMTYQGSGVAHYSPDGDILYQGVGGITHQFPNGSVTHWTSSGAVYRHPDGLLTYTPVGASQPQVLDPGALGPDPFPGPPLSREEVLALAREAVLPTLAPPPPTGGPAPAPAPAPAASPAPAATPSGLSSSIAPAPAPAAHV